MVARHLSVPTGLFDRISLLIYINTLMSSSLGANLKLYLLTSPFRQQNGSGSKGSVKAVFLFELASNQERGWTPIASTTDARAWEPSLAQMAPIKVTEIAKEYRASLLRRTHEAREQAQRNLTAFNCNQPITTQIENLKITMPASLAAEAERLSDFAGVVQLRGAREHYLLAALLLFNQDRSSKFIQQNPLVNDQLMWIIQLTTDAILSARKADPC